MGSILNGGVSPTLSRNVPFCPCLSSFVLLGAQNGDKSGQKRTNGDKTGHFGTNWETPPFIGVFLNIGFAEPMFCTMDSRGFRHFRAFRDFRKSSNQPPCLWLSELSSSFLSFS